MNTIKGIIEILNDYEKDLFYAFITQDFYLIRKSLILIENKNNLFHKTFKIGYHLHNDKVFLKISLKTKTFNKTITIEKNMYNYLFYNDKYISDDDINDLKSLL